MDKKIIRDLISLSGHKIGYVEFEKRDGSLRKMWFHGKISPSILKGGPRAYDPDEKRISWVRDIKLDKNDCVRSVRWDSVIKITVKGKTHVFK